LTNLHPAPAPAEDHDSPYDGLPASWSDSAKETYCQVEAENPSMDAATAATLYEACQLLAMADRMEERVNADGLMIPGSNGQMVPHGLLTEMRLARVQAMGALKAFGVAPGQNGASRAGAALAMKRHHGRTPGVRTAQ
jgi:hypothetical protein